MPSSGLLGKVRFVLWGIVGVAVIGAGVSMLGTLQQSVQDGRNAPAAIRIGGPFELTAHTGAAFSSQQLQGKPHLVFFGFTNCPDICPTTLVDISQLLDTLGNDADKLEALFITVDPERDSVEQMGLYMSAFDERITGLTGSREKIDGVIASFRAYAKRVPTGDGPEDYTMDHSATVYLFDGQQRLVSTLDLKEDKAVQLRKLQKLVARS